MKFIVLYKLFIFLIFLIDAVGVWLASLVYRANPKGKTTKTFILMTVFALVWVTSAASARIIAAYGYSLSYSLLLLKIAWFVTPLLFFALYYFSILIVGEEKKYALLTKITFFLGALLALAASTNLVLADVVFSKEIMSLVYGKAIIPFLAAILFIMCATLYPLFKKYNKLLGEEKERIKIFLIGVFILYFANIVFNIFLPIVLHISRYYYFGDYSLIFFLAFTAYSIARYEFMGIKVVLTELLVMLMASILIIAPFFVDLFWLKALLWFVFVLFLFFGYFLIQSVQREIHQKEILEEMVKGRTKDLEEEKNVAQERAREIEKRKADLEHFYKLTVGRELKMIELKKKIKDLEEKRPARGE